MNNQSNTNKLTPSITIPKKVKNLGKFLQFFSTKLTIKFTDKLFSTPVKFSVPEREKAMWRSAQKETVYINEIDKKINLLSYGYSKKKVLFVHGWSGRSTQIFMAADMLLERGYMLISFDAPAHGYSEGNTTNMDEFVACIKQIEKEFGPFVSAIGHSLGGMSLFNAISEGFTLKNLVTIGSGDTVSAVINNFVKNLELKPKIAKKLKSFYDKQFNRDVDEHSSHIKAKDVLIPTLLVHDDKDGDVAVSCSLNIRQNLQNSTLLITSGLGHTKILRDNDTMLQVVNFIIDNNHE